MKSSTILLLVLLSSLILMSMPTPIFGFILAGIVGASLLGLAGYGIYRLVNHFKGPKQDLTPPFQSLEHTPSLSPDGIPIKLQETGPHTSLSKPVESETARPNPNKPPISPPRGTFKI